MGILKTILKISCNIFLFTPIVYGYGYRTHGYLGKLTDIYLQKYEPILYNKVLDVLNGYTIESISTWADKIKNKKEFTWTKELHYIDILECRIDKYPKDVIDNYCDEHCITSALQDYTNSLKYNINYDYIQDGYKLTNNELLKFIIHFLQDFSQPMHLLGYDRGGNSFKLDVYIDGKNKTTNAHYMWDSMLPEHFIKNYPYTFMDNKIQKPDNYYNLLEDILNSNIKNVSCHIYPDTHYIIFDKYFNKDHFILLFNNYQTLIISTLKYIFE
jgi:hypothetical protein